MSEISAYFERHAERIQGFRASDHYYLKSKRRYRDCLSLVYPYLKEGRKSVLDLGGWEMGVLCSPLASSVRCVALDAPRQELQEAFNIAVEAFDIMSPAFPLEGSHFDVIFFLEILEHLPPPVDLVINRLHGLLNPKGLLVLSVPNLSFWQKRVSFFLFGRSPLKLSDQRDAHGGYHHIRPYTYDECLTLFTRYGFTVKRFLSGNYHTGWYNYPFHCLERILPRLAHKFIFLLDKRIQMAQGASPDYGYNRTRGMRQ